MTLKNALLALAFGGASLYFAAVAYWQYLILSQSSVLLVLDGFSWFDFGFAIFLSAALGVLAAYRFRDLLKWYSGIMRRANN